MKAAEALVLWNPGTSEVLVVKKQGSRDYGKYQYSDGACWGFWSGLKPMHRDLLLMIMFNTLVVRDGVPVEAAHKEFLKIREYRQRISPDIAGAQPEQRRLFDDKPGPGPDLSKYDYRGGPF